MIKTVGHVCNDQRQFSKTMMTQRLSDDVQIRRG